MTRQALGFCAIAVALAAAGIARFRGVTELASALRNSNGEFLIYFNNGNEIGLLDRGTIVPLNLQSRLETPKGCCPHHAIPSLSPDGRRIAYVHLKSAEPRREEGISLYDLDTKKETEVFQAEIIWSTAWAPDGNRLAVIANQHGDESHTLFIASGSSEPIKLSSSLDIDGIKYVVSDHAPPSWNHTGTQAAVELRRERGAEQAIIVLWDVAANRFHKLADGANPSWSPTQNVIAFFDLAGKSCFTINADSGDRKLLFAMGKGPFQSQSTLFFFPAVWSPDGKQLLFHKLVDADMVTDLYRFDLQTGKTQRLARSEVQVINWRAGK